MASATGIDLALASEPEVPPGQQMMLVSRPTLAWRTQRPDSCHSGVQIGQLHVAENQILLVGHAQLSERMAVGEVGDFFHLLDGDVARRDTGLLEGQRDGGVTRFFGAGGRCACAKFANARSTQARLSSPASVAGSRR